MTFTFTFQAGFYNSSLGVVLFLIATGYAWRHRLRPSVWQGAVFGTLGLLLYLTHLVAYAEFLCFSSAPSLAGDCAGPTPGRHAGRCQGHSARHSGSS